jgi:hypothetical protein
LTKLEILNLAFSDSVKDEGMHEISQMTQLLRLDLCWLRNITGEGFAKISTLTKLVHLDITNIDGVPDTYMTTLLALPYLELLDTSYYKPLTDFGISIIGKLSNITRLVLGDHKKVTPGAMDLIANLTKLNHLAMNMGPNTNDLFFSALFNLTHLSCKMNEQNFSVLTDLTNMQDLNISVVNDFNEEFFRCISAMTRLEVLGLRGPRCNIAIDTLTCCTNLTRLELEECLQYDGPEENQYGGMSTKAIEASKIGKPCS